MAGPTITATRFRIDLYKYLDTVLTTGRPLQVALRGRKVTIVPDKHPKRLAAMQARPDYIVGDVDSLLDPVFDIGVWEKKAKRRRTSA